MGPDKFFTRAIPTGALLLLAFCLLPGCSSSSSSQSKEPPPPPQIYVVKHMTADGSVIASYRATDAYTYQGCVRFRAVGDSTDLKYRIACGNVSVNPEEK